jgi:phosphatidate cytidylyltransferase
MLKYRLLIGIPLALAFVGILLLDGYLDASWTLDAQDDKPLQGTFFFVLICLLQIPAHLELRHLVQAKGLFLPVEITLPGAVFICITAYVHHRLLPLPWLSLAVVAAFFMLLAVYYRRYGLNQVLRDCGVGTFSLVYLGLLGAFAIRLRVDYGVWALFMYVCTVKLSDVGAYTFGRLYGKHKFAPKLSPGKTWEGLAGAAVAAAVVALVFSLVGGPVIMTWPLALLFGVIMAVVGQLGDLAESMLKRDAAVKDSSSMIPGFGGVLDILDSPLAAAPVAYIFFGILT